MDEIKYNARHGTIFLAYKDLGEIQVRRPSYLPDNLFAADCIEFGGWHGTMVHPNLSSFQGYDCATVKIANGHTQGLNWVFERSSGYAGWRCQKCGAWVYDKSDFKCRC